MISRLFTASETFSSRIVERFSYDGMENSVIADWFKIVRLVMVAGRCSVFRMPPFGSSRPVMAVPSK